MKQAIQAFIQKNQVMITALISALILVIQQAKETGQTSWKVIGFAALISFIGVIANQWQGKGLTILGILGTMAGTFHTIWQTGSFTWNEFILSFIMAILMAVSGSLKPQKAKRRARV